MARYRTLFERLVANTVEGSTLYRGCVCWLWQGKTDQPRRYGHLNVRVDGRHRTVKAHRAMAEVILGRTLHPILETVQHGCDVTLCINPWHFDLIPNAENVRDMHAKLNGRQRQTYPPMLDPAAWSFDSLFQTMPVPRARLFDPCPF